MNMKVPVIMVITADNAEEFIGVKVADMLNDFPVKVTHRPISLNALISDMANVIKEIEALGIEVLIVSAGVLSQLPALVAAQTALPVIAVPVKTPLLNGLDTLMAAIRTPAAFSAPAVAIDSGENAALLAVQILALKYPALSQQLTVYRQSMRDHVKQQNIKLKEEIVRCVPN